jgi:hypothetical protein
MGRAAVPDRDGSPAHALAGIFFRRIVVNVPAVSKGCCLRGNQKAGMFAKRVDARNGDQRQTGA